MTNDGLINSLVQRAVLHTPRIIAAFRAVDRGDFVPSSLKGEAYDDHPLPLGYGATISQPWTVAFMIELLNPHEGQQILDVGSGSGWTTALLTAITGASGYVVGVERIAELVLYGRERLKKYKFKNAEIVRALDDLGFPAHAPYDRILVSAAGNELPSSLLSQLKDGGILVIPVRSQIWRVRKQHGGLDIKKYEGFAFVPLVEK